MFDLALANNPATALIVGTNSNLTFELLPPGPGGLTVRSVGPVNLTAPHTLKIGHSVRTVKGLVYSSTKNKAPDVMIDSHLVRFDKALPLPVMGVYDPNFQVTYGARIILEVPRVGAESPTHQQVMDQLLRAVVLLNPSTNAGLIRLLNGES